MFTLLLQYDSNRRTLFNALEIKSRVSDFIRILAMLFSGQITLKFKSAHTESYIFVFVVLCLCGLIVVMWPAIWDETANC